MLIFPIKKNLPLAENGFWVGWMSALVQHCALQGKAVCSRSSQPSSHQIMMHCSMYFRSWLIQLNRSYKYNENIACTGISTLNGHISKTVKFFEKMKKIRCNYFLILGLDRWFRNFPQCVFCHFWLI